VAYVGNVPFEVTREELAEAFADCGVKLVRLHTDQATGRSKGYAHVHFEDEAGLDRAMKLDGHVLRGRGIRVSYGQPKRGG
jgi:nucleolin